MTAIKNPISGKLTPKSLGDYLALFDKSVHADIVDRLNRADVDGAVQFVNLQLDSSQAGASTSLIYGPGCTYKTLEEIAASHLYDLPSRRQYPQAYYAKTEAP